MVAQAGVEAEMAFVRTIVIITSLMLGWFALRAETSAHSMVLPSAANQLAP